MYKGTVKEMEQSLSIAHQYSMHVQFSNFFMIKNKKTKKVFENMQINIAVV